MATVAVRAPRPRTRCDRRPSYRLALSTELWLHIDCISTTNQYRADPWRALREERLDDGRQEGAAGDADMRGAGEHGELALRQEPHGLGGVLDVDEV